LSGWLRGGDGGGGLRDGGRFLAVPLLLHAEGELAQQLVEDRRRHGALLCHCLALLSGPGHASGCANGLTR
jgi:hypothetical protein